MDLQRRENLTSLLWGGILILFALLDLRSFVLGVGRLPAFLHFRSPVELIVRICIALLILSFLASAVSLLARSRLAVVLAIGQFPWRGLGWHRTLEGLPLEAFLVPSMLGPLMAFLTYLAIEAVRITLTILAIRHFNPTEAPALRPSRFGRPAPLVRSVVSFVRDSGRSGLVVVLAGVALLARDACVRAPGKLQDYLDGKLDQSSLIYPWAEKLRSEKPKDRRKAATILLGWLEETRIGVQSGEIAWIQTPYMNLPWINRGWDLIWELPQSLGPCLPDESTVIAAWYLAQSGRRFHSAGMGMLRETKGEQADSILVSLITLPHHDHIVVRDAVEEVITRNLAVSAEAIRRLAASHRPSLAASAHRLNDKLGYPPLAAFDSLAALRSPSVLGLMSQVDSLVVDRIPPTAKYVQLRATEVWPNINQDRYRINGWLLNRDSRGYEFYDLYGTFVRGSWMEVSRDVFGEVSYRRKVEMVPSSLQDEAQRIREPGFWSDPERGGPSVYRNGPWSIGIVRAGAEFARPAVFKIHLAWWLFHYGPPDLCAQVLLNAIEDYPTDEDFVGAARIGIGETLGLRMFVAFVGQRDYAEALRLAQLIVDRYQDSPYADQAQLLVAQLPDRRGDFHEFKLPTRLEWETIRKGMSRDDQIAYLCGRLSLLNCSNGNYAAEQYADPSGLSADATDLLNPGKNVVINPYQVLLPSWRSGSEDSASVGLEMADVPYLARYLADDRVILSVRYPHRDPGTTRWLDRVSSVTASLINAVADTELCDVHEFGRLQGEERQAYAQRVTTWATERQGKTPAELLRGRLAEASASDEKMRCLETLARIEGRGAMGDILRLVEEDSLDSNDLRRVLSMRRLVSAEALVPLALSLAHRGEPWLQREAAATLIEAGRDEGRAVLRRGLRTDGLTPQTVYDLFILLKDPTPEDNALADSLLLAAPDTLIRGDDGVRVLSALVSVNRPEAYRWVLEALADTSETGHMMGHDSGWIRPRRREVVAAELLRSNAVPENVRVVEFFGLSYMGRELAILRLENWVKARAAG